MASRELWRNAHPSDSSTSSPQIYIGPPEKHDVTVTYTSTRGQKKATTTTTTFSFSVSLSAVMSETPCQIFRGVCSSPRCWFSARMGTWGERRVGCSPTASPRFRRRTMPATHRHPRSMDRGMRRCRHQVTVTASAGFIFDIHSISSAHNRDVFMMGYITTKDTGALLTAVRAVS